MKKSFEQNTQSDHEKEGLERPVEDIKEEVDKPPKEISFDSPNQVTTISDKMADYLERQADYADRMDKHVYKKHGLKLMIGCGIMYCSLVLIDTALLNFFKWETSGLMTGFVELLKFVISTLIGYVFSEIKKDKAL